MKETFENMNTIINKEKEPIPYKHFDDIIDLIWSGNKATELKKRVRDNDMMAQERILEIERANKQIQAFEGDENEIEYVDKQKYEITCLIRELEGKPAEGTTDEEKKEFRKYNPTTMTDEDIERAKENMKGINIS
jgi:hypothetical protein